MLKEDTEFSPHLLASDLDLANRMLWLMTLKLQRAESGTQAGMHCTCLTHSGHAAHSCDLLLLNLSDFSDLFFFAF